MLFICLTSLSLPPSLPPPSPSHAYHTENYTHFKRQARRKKDMLQKRRCQRTWVRAIGGSNKGRTGGIEMWGVLEKGKSKK